MKITELIGRILFSIIFIRTILFHFSENVISYASNAGVPFASTLVPLSGIMAFLGGLSIALGYKTKTGAWLIISFLLPVTFIMHPYWKETDPGKMEMQLTMFFKNISMLGAAFIINFFGPGPLSIDKRHRK